MFFTIENEKYEIKLRYAKEDGYPAYRMATLLMHHLDKVGARAEILRGYTIELKRAPSRSGDYEITVEENKITAIAGGILADQCVNEYFMRLIAQRLAPYSTKGNAADVFLDSNRYAFSKQGDHRVMFYNVLWDNDFLRAAGERNIMAAEIVREYSPAVVGLQECGKRKRAECYMYDIQKMMERVGYIETPVEVKNEYHDVNCTPLYYDPEQVEYLDGAYVWYSLQCNDANVHPMDRSSKSFTWGLFRDKKTGEQYIVSSTHMCTQKDDIREVQAKEACEIYAQLTEKYNVPIILGGDFNSLPTSKCFRYYREVAKYPTAYEQATQFADDTKTYHPYPELDRNLGIVRATAAAERHLPERCIDHILYPHMPSGFQTSVYGVVINDYTLAASDHFPIFTDFCI